MEFRKDIQGLRAIAVISVWLFHLNYNVLPGGFIGVDIFFVISGFLIGSIILHQKENNKFSFKSFYISRIKRIVPAYYIFLLIVSIAALFIYLPLDSGAYRGKLLHSLVFNSNNFFAKLNNYFGAASSENPLLHTWTLSIEMQFYLFLPILLFLLNRKKALYISIGLLILLYTYTQYQILILSNQDLMYFSLLARAPEFMLGVILSLIKWENNIKEKWQSLLSILGLAMIILSAIFIDSGTIFPGIITLIPCGGAVLILMNKRGIVNKILSNKVPVYIGELSYSIYLWHWGILALMRYKYAEYILTTNQYLFAIVLTLGLSFLSYKFIEGHFKKYDLKKFIIRFSIVPIAIICFAFSFNKLSLKLYGADFPEELTSPNAMGIDNHNYFKKDVILGDTHSNDTLLLLGNSHALVLKPFLDVVGKSYNFCFRSVTNDSYPTVPGLYGSAFPNSFEYDKYKDLIEIVNKKIPHSPIIIIGTTFKDSRNAQLITSLDSLSNVLLKNNQHIILFSDFPVLKVNPIRKNRTILKSRSQYTKLEKEYNKPPIEIMELVNSKENIHYLDLSGSEAFSNAPFYNDTIMYYDKDHINKYGSIIFAKYSGSEFGELIKGILNRDSSNIVKINPDN